MSNGSAARVQRSHETSATTTTIGSTNAATNSSADPTTISQSEALAVRASRARSRIRLRVCYL